MKKIFLSIFGSIILFLNCYGQTQVSGHITSNTTWTLAGSPYYFTDSIQIEENSTLNIEPGVILHGKNHTLQVFGNLIAIGNGESPIIIDSVQILAGKKKSPLSITFAGLIDLEYIQCNPYGSNIAGNNSPYGEIYAGGFILKNSMIKNSSLSNGTYLVNELLFEYNIFSDSKIVIAGKTGLSRQDYFHSVISYNILSSGYFSFGFPNVSSEVKNNSFMDTSKISVNLITNNIDLSNNYWNTLSKNTIESMIKCHDYQPVNYIPFLTHTPLMAKFNADTLIGIDTLSVHFTDQSEGHYINRWHWDFGDGDTSNFKSGIHVYHKPGNYTVKLTVSTPTYSHTEIKEAYINVLQQMPILGFTQDTRALCPGGQVQFKDTTSGNISERRWDLPGSVSLYSEESDPIVTYNNPGTYQVKLVIKSIKSFDNKYIIPYNDSIIKTSWIRVKPLVTNLIPSICTVSVNDSNKNMIIWEKLSSSGIDSYFIYRESTSQSGAYKLIGSLANTSQPIFIDTLSNARIQSNKYRIVYKDSCGHFSEPSTDHKTMHLNVNIGIDAGYNLTWEEYEGFQVTSYRIFRGTTKENFELIGTTSGGSTSYSDLNAPTGDVYYYIEAPLQLPCDISNLPVFSSSRSNIVGNIKSTGVSMNAFSEELKLYPIPSNNILIVKYEHLKNPIGVISSIDGRIVLEVKLEVTGGYVDIKNLPNGFYNLQVSDYENIFNKKFIKE